MVTQCSLSYGKGRFCVYFGFLLYRKIWLHTKPFYSSAHFSKRCFVIDFALQVVGIHHVIIKNFLVGNFQEQPPEVFYKKGVPKNFAKFTGKNLCQCFFFNEGAGFRFQVAKFLRVHFLQNTSERLPLNFFRK